MVIGDDKAPKGNKSQFSMALHEDDFKRLFQGHELRKGTSVISLITPLNLPLFNYVEHTVLMVPSSLFALCNSGFSLQRAIGVSISSHINMEKWVRND
jgi:hypothetical protein